MKHSPETAEWIELAGRNRAPFAHCDVPGGYDVIALVEDGCSAPTNSIVDFGTVRWRVVNKTMFPIELHLRARDGDALIEWCDARGAKLRRDTSTSQEAITIRLSVGGARTDLPHFPHEDKTRFCRVNLKRPGNDSDIETELLNHIAPRLHSHFSIGGNMKVLKLALESAKGIPVLGQPCVGPLLRYYDERDWAQFEERVFELLRRGDQVTSEILQSMLELNDLTRETWLGLELLRERLDNFVVDPDEATGLKERTEWRAMIDLPAGDLPYPDRYLILHLEALFSRGADTTAFDMALATAEFPDDGMQTIEKRVVRFVRTRRQHPSRFVIAIEELAQRVESEVVADTAMWMRRNCTS